MSLHMKHLFPIRSYERKLVENATKMYSRKMPRIDRLLSIYALCQSNKLSDESKSGKTTLQKVWHVLGKRLTCTHYATINHRVKSLLIINFLASIRQHDTLCRIRRDLPIYIKYKSELKKQLRVVEPYLIGGVRMQIDMIDQVIKIAKDEIYSLQVCQLLRRDLVTACEGSDVLLKNADAGIIFFPKIFAQPSNRLYIYKPVFMYTSDVEAPIQQKKVLPVENNTDSSVSLDMEVPPPPPSQFLQSNRGDPIEYLEPLTMSSKERINSSQFSDSFTGSGQISSPEVKKSYMEPGHDNFDEIIKFLGNMGVETKSFV